MHTTPAVSAHYIEVSKLVNKIKLIFCICPLIYKVCSRYNTHRYNTNSVTTWFKFGPQIFSVESMLYYRRTTFYASAHLRGPEALCFWVVCACVRPVSFWLMRLQENCSRDFDEIFTSYPPGVPMNWLDIGLIWSTFKETTGPNMVKFWLR